MKEIDKTAMNRLKEKIEKNRQYVQKKQKERNHDMDSTKALSMSVLMDYYNIGQDDAYEALTEGSLDCHIDAFYYDLELDEEDNSNLIIIQSKFKKDYGATGAFQEKDIRSCISVCQKILRGKDLDLVNENLGEKIREYRAELKDNGHPHTRISLILATNGMIHEEFKTIDDVKDFERQGHSVIFLDASSYGKMQETKEAKLLTSLIHHDDSRNNVFKYEKYDGGIFSCSLFDLMQYYKEAGEEALLNQNVRFKIKKSRINQEIEKSFLEDPKFFCFLNNGITLVCSDFKIGDICSNKTSILIKNPSIVNGGQTISTLYSLYSKKKNLLDFDLEERFKQASIIIRIYKVPQDYILKIAIATNSQNPIDIVDLRSNDESQKKVKEYFSKKGIGLIVKEGEDTLYYNDIITNEYLLQVYVALYEGLPHLARISKRKVFEKYFECIFNENIQDHFEILFRCYELSKFVNNKKHELINKTEKEKKILIAYASFAIMYTMNQIDSRITNKNIPLKNIDCDQLFDSSILIIQEIIDEKNRVLEDRFSLNNLFKNSEIKDLIDLKLRPQTSMAKTLES